EPVRDVDDLVAGPTRGALSRPAGAAGRSQCGFHAGEVRPFEIAAGSPMDDVLLVAVVAGEDDDRVVAERQPVDLVEELAKVAVEFEQAVGPVAIAALAPVL